MAAGQGVVRRWAEMVKFSHSIFALPFAVLATFLAGRELDTGRPTAGQLGLIVLCMVAARSAAMTFNRIVDARIDVRNPRTAARPIPAGTISMGQAAAFLAIACVVFVGACGGFWWAYANGWPILLSLPVLAYLCFYSYTKRFTRWSHFVLGSAIALSPVAAWIALDPASLGWPAVMLAAVVTLWIGGFDVIYACQDIEADLAERLQSLPARLGPGPALWIARAAHGLAVLLLLALSPIAGLGWIYLAGVAAVTVLLVWEHSLVRADDFSRVNLAFFTANGLVSVLLGVAGVVDVLIGPEPVLRLW